MGIRMKKLLLSVSGAVSFVIFLILLGVTNHLGNSQDSQRMASRWSERKDMAQVSCFFSSNAALSIDRIEDFEHSMEKALLEASITSESENPGARLWADAYSAQGTVSIASDKTSLEADAIGIGGDFFLFHPLKLLAGGYFSGNDLNHDSCVIDEDAAWQLFGSNDVAGMTVYIGGVPHLVAGVVERPVGRLAEAAGLDSTLVYVSYQTLQELGSIGGVNYSSEESGNTGFINHYEIVMPNPVSNFALNHVRETIGSEERTVEVLENTSRYSLGNRLKILAQFDTRSMNGKAIIYPYWENIARGYEDILALLTLFLLLFLSYPAVLLLVCFIKWWKHKGWTFKSLWQHGRDRMERAAEKRRAERKAGHGAKHGGKKADEVILAADVLGKEKRHKKRGIRRGKNPEEREEEWL